MTTESPTAEDTRMDVGAIFGAVLSRWLRIVLVTLLLLGATYAVLMVTPKMYESYASLLVEARDNAFLVPPSGAASGGGGTSITIDAAISSQIELIKSRDTLLKVVDAVNLRSVPEFNGSGPNPLNLIFQLIGRKPAQTSIDDTVLSNLNDRITVIRERDSAIISIYVRSQDPQLAANIANAIAAEHVKRRADQTLQDTAEASSWLEQEIVKLRQRVSDADTAVANFKSQNDLFAGTNNTSLVDQQLSSIASQITDAQQRQNAAQSRAALIRGMIDAGQPIGGLSDVQNSTVIKQLSQSLADLQGQLAQKSSTLLPNHPTIRALNAQIRELNRQIAAEGRRVADSLESEAKVEGDLVNSLQAGLAKAKQSATTAATSGVTLDELEREGKAQRDLLESYLLQYREALSRSDSASALPDVRVVSMAAPSVAPAAPKTGLILAAVGLGALALQIGAIMLAELVSGRAVVMRQVAFPSRGPGPGGTRIAETVVETSDDEPLLPFDRLAAEPTGATRARVGIAAASLTLAESLAAPDEDLDARVRAATDEVLAAGLGRRPTVPLNDVGEAETAVAAAIAAPTPDAEEADSTVVVLAEPDLEAAPEETVAGPSEHQVMAELASSDATDAALADLAAAMADELTDNQGEVEIGDSSPSGVADVVDHDHGVAGHLDAGPDDVVEPSDPATEAADTVLPEQPKEQAAAEAEAIAEPVAPIKPAAPATIPAEMKDYSGRYPSPLTTLTADIALGRVRVVMIAGLSSAEDCLPVSDSIVAEALYAGLTIARVDAGTGDVSNEQGITDLAAGHASFGDIVHRGSHEGLTEIPWGRQIVLDRRSNKPTTLIEALTDLYEVVVVITGRVGLSSTLPLFTGIDCRLVLAAVGRPSADHLESALADTAALGFRQAQVIVAPVPRAEVA